MPREETEQHRSFDSEAVPGNRMKGASLFLDGSVLGSMNDLAFHYKYPGSGWCAQSCGARNHPPAQSYADGCAKIRVPDRGIEGPVSDGRKVSVGSAF